MVFCTTTGGHVLSVVGFIVGTVSAVRVTVVLLGNSLELTLGNTVIGPEHAIPAKHMSLLGQSLQFDRSVVCFIHLTW
jgi:hypothetical protein